MICSESFHTSFQKSCNKNISFFKILTLYIISCCFKYFFKCCVYIGLLVCEFRSDLFFTSLQDFTWSFSKMISFLHRIQHSNFGGILFYSDRGNTKLFYSFSLNVISWRDFVPENFDEGKKPGTYFTFLLPFCVDQLLSKINCKLAIEQWVWECAVHISSQEIPRKLVRGGSVTLIDGLINDLLTQVFFQGGM